MKYNILDISRRKKKWMGSGGTGSYYRLNKKQGVKLFTESYSAKYPRYTEKWARQGMPDAVREARTLKKAFVSKLVPKTFGTYIVKFGKDYYPGILMEHLEGYEVAKKCFITGGYRYDWGEEPLKKGIKIAKELEISKIKKSRELYVLIEKLLIDRADLRHWDVHWQNILFKVKNKVVIDFKVIDFEDVDYLS